MAPAAPRPLALRLLDRAEEILISALMAAATLLIFVAVLHRYGLGIRVLYPYLSALNTAWAQELCIYLFVWMAKFGAAYGVRTGIHVGVDVLVRSLKPGAQRRFIIFGLSAGALFTAVVMSLGANLVWRIANTGQVSSDLEWPMWIIYLAIPLGSALMCFRFLEVLVAYVRTGSLPHHDPGDVPGLEEGAA